MWILLYFFSFLICTFFIKPKFYVSGWYKNNSYQNSNNTLNILVKKCLFSHFLDSFVRCCKFCWSSFENCSSSLTDETKFLIFWWFGQNFLLVVSGCDCSENKLSLMYSNDLLCNSFAFFVPFQIKSFRISVNYSQVAMLTRQIQLCCNTYGCLKQRWF